MKRPWRLGRAVVGYRFLHIATPITSLLVWPRLDESRFGKNRPRVGGWLLPPIFPALWPEVRGRTPFGSVVSHEGSHEDHFTGDYAADFKTLRQRLKKAGRTLPPLYKYYTEVAEFRRQSEFGFP